MKNIKIRLRWFNLGALVTTFVWLWTMSEQEKKKEAENKVSKTEDPAWANADLSERLDNIYNNYKGRQNA